MSNPSKPNALMENLAGATDIMLGRDKGLARIDTSSDGVWWSFAGLGLTGFIDASALSARYGTHQVMSLDDPPSKIVFIIGSLIIGLIAYAVSMALLYAMCREPEEKQRFSYAVIVHNWAAPVVSLAVLPFLFLSVSSPQGEGAVGGIWTLFTVFLIGVFVTIGIRILRASLEVPFGKALLMFSVTTLASLVMIQWLEGVAGFSST